MGNMDDMDDMRRAADLKVGDFFRTTDRSVVRVYRIDRDLVVIMQDHYGGLYTWLAKPDDQVEVLDPTYIMKTWGL